MWLLKIPPLNNKSYAFIELSTMTGLGVSENLLIIPGGVKLGKIVAILIVIILCLGCGDHVKESKAELQRRNIEFSDMNFLTYVTKGDIQVVTLFLDSGMNPNIRIKDKPAVFGKIKINKMAANFLIDHLPT